MTSILAPVKVLTSNYLKGELADIPLCCCIRRERWFFFSESQRWKSEMTLETLLTAVPSLKDLDRDEVRVLSHVHKFTS